MIGMRDGKKRGARYCDDGVHGLQEPELHDFQKPHQSSGTVGTEEIL
jgi:hypothetical protein